MPSHSKHTYSPPRTEFAVLKRHDAWRSRNTDFPVLLVVLKGRCQLETAQVAFEIDESYASIIPRNREYESRVLSSKACIAHRVLDSPCAHLSAGVGPFRRLEDSNSYYLISRLLSLRLFQTQSAAENAVVNELSRHLAAVVPDREEGNGDYVGPVVDVLHRRALDCISLEELADFADVHPMTLTRKFREQRGCSIGEFRQRILAERAFYRVIKTADPLSGLSLDCGYSDQSHMTRQFRRFFGATPSLLRKATEFERHEREPFFPQAPATWMV